MTIPISAQPISHCPSTSLRRTRACVHLSARKRRTSSLEKTKNRQDQDRRPTYCARHRVAEAPAQELQRWLIVEFFKEDVMTEEYVSAVDACIQCAQECEACASACLNEGEVTMLAECIRLNRDCAEICWTTAAFMSRDSRFSDNLCALCAEICDVCSAECAQHAYDHCQRCAEACASCAEECRQMTHAAA